MPIRQQIKALVIVVSALGAVALGAWLSYAASGSYGVPWETMSTKNFEMITLWSFGVAGPIGAVIALSCIMYDVGGTNHWIRGGAKVPWKHVFKPHVVVFCSTWIFAFAAAVTLAKHLLY